MKTLRKNIIIVAALAVSSAMTVAAQANPVACAFEKGDKLQFNVTFNADFEQGLILLDKANNKRLRLFNNFAGQGAGGEWHQGAGSWSYTVKDSLCIELQALHKTGGPDGNKPWVKSNVSALGSGRLGFDDGVDADYNDIRVKIKVVSTDGTVGIPEMR